MRQRETNREDRNVTPTHLPTPILENMVKKISAPQMNQMFNLRSLVG